MQLSNTVIANCCQTHDEKIQFHDVVKLIGHSSTDIGETKHRLAYAKMSSATTARQNTNYVKTRRKANRKTVHSILSLLCLCCYMSLLVLIYEI